MLTMRGIRVVGSGLFTAGVLAWAGPAWAADGGETKGTAVTNVPVQVATVRLPQPAASQVTDGLVIQVGPSAWVLYDPSLLRVAAAWTGAALAPAGAGGVRELGGAPLITTAPVLGWAAGKSAFADPRPRGSNELPGEEGRWNGVYLSGDAVVLSYTVKGVNVLEQPSAVTKAGETAFFRTFKVETATQDLALLVCEAAGAMAMVNQEGSGGILHSATALFTRVGSAGLPKGVRFEADGARMLVRIPKGTPASTFKIALWGGAREQASALDLLLTPEVQLADPSKGGARHWQAVETARGVVGGQATPDGAYALDVVRTASPLAGVDLFASGSRAAVASADGRVWLVSGLDDRLEAVRWQLFAAGLGEVRGVRVVADAVYVAGRGRVMRLTDLNKDGEADAIESYRKQASDPAELATWAAEMLKGKTGAPDTADLGLRVPVTSERWGPFRNRVVKSIDGGIGLEGEKEGFPLKLGFRPQAGRFDPKSGQLYLVGTEGAGAGVLARVRYTGKPVQFTKAK